MPSRIHVHDPLQEGYVYTCVEKQGQSFDGRFLPQLSPRDMLRLGVYGGNYFEGHVDEFPREWFVQAKVYEGKQYGPNGLGELINKKRERIRFGRGYDESLNFFVVDASQSREEWERNGWIHADDPRGWFQWYCRYYMGRRHEDDSRQIERWARMARHVRWLQGACAVGDVHCRPRQRQALLHWAYDSRVL